MRRQRRGNDLCDSFQNLSIKGKPKKSNGNSSKAPALKITPPIPSKKNSGLFNIHYSGSKVVTYRNLHPSDEMYVKINSLITNDRIVIENIVEVKNPFLKKAYELKKLQKKGQYGQVVENLLFHGTKKACVNDICTFNFNWRLFGSSVGHKYGKGVSFSRNAMYASNYSDGDDYHKVMIVAKVLIANVCQGHNNMNLPPDGYDSSQKGNDGIVLVKYEDSECYPAYKLYYHIEDEEDSDDEEDDYYEHDDDNDDYYEYHNDYNGDYYEYDYDYNYYYNYNYYYD